MAKLREKDLHLFVDGELSPAEAERIRRIADRDTDIAHRIERIESLRRVLGEHFSSQAEAPELDLVPQIRRAIAESDKPSLGERLGWFFSWHGRVLAWSGAGLAAAGVLLALVLVLGRGGSVGPAGSRSKATQRPSVSNRLVVEDYQGPPPTIFEIPDDKGSTTVLWVQPPAGEQEEEQDGQDHSSRSPGSI